MEESHVVNVDCAVRRDDAYLFIERAASEEHAAGQPAFPGGKVENPPDEFRGRDPPEFLREYVDAVEAGHSC